MMKRFLAILLVSSMVFMTQADAFASASPCPEQVCDSGVTTMAEQASAISVKSVDTIAKGSSTKITADFSAANGIDWIHINKTDGYNQKARMGGARLTFSGTVGTGPNKRASVITDWTNVKLSYTNGTNPAAASSSELVAYTGLNSAGVFRAPSKAGALRTLTVFAGSYAGKIRVTATMGQHSVQVQPFEVAKGTAMARYVLDYVGDDSEDPLVVRFELVDNSADTNWANLGFYGAMITGDEEAASEPYLAFTTPELTGREAVTAPASGKTRRDVTAALFNEKGEKVPDQSVVYSLEQPVDGVYLKDDVLYITSALRKSTTVTVVAKNAKNPNTFAKKQVELVKNTELVDAPAPPLQKNGWKLFYDEEFDNGRLDERKWSGNYLRSWTTDDLSKGHSFFDDGNLVLTAPNGMVPWCSQDKGQRVSGMQTFERQHLHRFGTVTGSRELPTFNGFATKYGYFEVRMRLPDTKDGSHFAWWMIGTQDDQHPTASLAGGEQYPEGQYSNETAEFDIIEQTTDAYAPVSPYKTNLWRPVIHPNGTGDLKYLWVPGTTITHDATNEFHVYGFEWDENGTSFYLDGKKVQSTDRTPNYRMLTILSLYPGKLDGTGGMGKDRGIYPKDAVIDYFRVYKKDEAPKPTSVVLNNYNSPSYLYVPQEGAAGYPMHASVLDQFDKPINAAVKWRFSSNIQGYNATSAAQPALKGVSINPDTGVITVNANAPLNQDLFVTAYVNDKVREVKHIKLSKDAPVSEKVVFKTKADTIARGTSLDVSAKVYDQYFNPMQTVVEYSISADITGAEQKQIEGVGIDANGVLSVSGNVPADTYIVVTARAVNDANPDRMQSLVLKVV